MKRSLIAWLCCPHCRGDLSLAEAAATDDEIDTGVLRCGDCETSYPIMRSIPRFVSADNYASSFGLQWARFRQTQLDSYSGTTISRDRFLRQTAWTTESLAGAAVLDVGCGAGRFTEIALSLGAEVFAMDYSEAVDACRQNFPSHPNLHVVQADVYALPFQPERFDYIYCLGVLQNTPDPRRACLALPLLLKPGGQLAVDIYPRYWSSLLHPKYWLRPITRRLPRPILLRAIERAAPVLLPVSRAAGQVPALGRAFQRLVPIANYHGIYPLNAQQLRDWAILDTFDWLSPAYDKPERPDVLRSWLVEAGLEDIHVAKIAHLVGRGRKPLKKGIP
jgi:SAM-dependent methyltransferase